MNVTNTFIYMQEEGEGEHTPLTTLDEALNLIKSFDWKTAEDNTDEIVFLCFSTDDNDSVDVSKRNGSFHVSMILQPIEPVKKLFGLIALTTPKRQINKEIGEVSEKFMTEFVTDFFMLDFNQLNEKY